ncbi:30S ribosomal protein S17 [Chloroflexota bacterium]
MEKKLKTMIGRVISDKMDKTVVVAVAKTKRHPLYKKTIRRVVKYKVHDVSNQCKLADKVLIVGTRPLSREKRWRVAEIIERKEVAEVQPEEVA